MGEKLKFILRLIVSLGFLVILVSRLDLEQVRLIVKRADVSYVVWPILLLSIDRVWMAWKWRMLLAALGATPSLYEAVRVYYVSSFQGLALPLGGLGPDLVRYAYLRLSDFSGSTVAASIVLERLIGLLATVTVAVVSGVLLVVYVPDKLLNDVVGLIWMGVGLALLLALPLFHPGLQRWIYRRLSSTRLFTRFVRIRRLTDTFKQYRAHRRTLVLNYVLSVIEQLFIVAAFYFGFQIFHVPVTWMECLAVIPVSMMVQRLPISYAGIGVREGSLVLLFGALGAGYDDILIASMAMFVLILVSLIPGMVWGMKSIRIQSASTLRDETSPLDMEMGKTVLMTGTTAGKS